MNGSFRADEDSEYTFSPHVNPVSERLLEDSRAVPSNFLARQRFFHDLKQQKLKELQQGAVGLCTSS